MQEKRTQEDRNNPEPFVIWKNARKDIKKQEKRRKQSYQHPSTSKKPRKMTIEVSHARSLEQSPVIGKSSSEGLQIEDIEQQDINKNPQKNIEEIGSISEEQEQAPHQHGQHNQEIQLQHNIPFNCNEWELDKESPYLKNFNSSIMDHQIDQLKLDN